MTKQKEQYDNDEISTILNLSRKARCMWLSLSSHHHHYQRNVPYSDDDDNNNNNNNNNISEPHHDNDQVTYEQVECLYRLAWDTINKKIKEISEKSTKNRDQHDRDHLPYMKNYDKKRKLPDTITTVRQNDHGDKDFVFMSTNDNDDDSYDTYDQIRKQIGEKLALLLLQTGRSDEADEILLSLRYSCRLASCLFNYDLYNNEHKNDNDHSNNHLNHLKENHRTSSSEQEIPCRIYQNFVTDHEMNVFQSTFINRHNTYWTDHHYEVEPPSPYYSYLIPLKDHNDDNEYGTIGHFVVRLQQFLSTQIIWKQRGIHHASYCEMWAHNRPHCTGHQFHFDSDNEGHTDILRNPICSSILYLTDVGGPSVITNQRLISRYVANKCWLCYPNMMTPTSYAATAADSSHQRDSTITKSNCTTTTTTIKNHKNHRHNNILCVFDGKLLHGVMPGKPQLDPTNHNAAAVTNSEQHQSSNRVTVMFAFWKNIRVRSNDDHNADHTDRADHSRQTSRTSASINTNKTNDYGAARLLPTQSHWAQQLRQKIPVESLMGEHDKDTVEQVEMIKTIDPVPLERVYEKVGTKDTIWKREMGLPSYDQIFQGF